MENEEMELTVAPEETAEGQTERKTLSEKLVGSLVYWLRLAAVLFMTVAFIFGVCEIGKTYSVVSVITEIFGMFSLHAKWYVYGITVAQAIAYVAVLVMLIKGVVEILRCIKMKSENGVHVGCKAEFNKTIIAFFSYVFISGMLYPLELNSWGIVALIVASAVYLVTNLLVQLVFASGDLLYILFYIVRQVFAVALLIILGNKLTMPCITGLFTGFPYFTVLTEGLEGIYLFYLNFLLPIFYIILTIMFLKAFDWELYDYADEKKRAWLTFMITTIVLIGVDLVIHIATNAKGFEVMEYLGARKEMIALVMVAIAARVSAIKLVKKVDKEKKATENA